MSLIVVIVRTLEAVRQSGENMSKFAGKEE
jgi:hypothetical protein